MSRGRSLRAEARPAPIGAPCAGLAFCESSRAGGHTGALPPAQQGAVPLVVLRRGRRTTSDRASYAPRTSRAGSRGRRPSGPGGGSRRPPGDQQSIQIRAGCGDRRVIIVIILWRVGVHSCQVERRPTRRCRTTPTASRRSTSSPSPTASSCSPRCPRRRGPAAPPASSIRSTRSSPTSRSVYNKAKDTSVPDQVKSGNADFVHGAADARRRDRRHRQRDPARARQHRHGGSINAIAAETASSTPPTSSTSAMPLPQIYSALHAAGHPLQPDQRRPVRAQRRVGPAQLPGLSAARRTSPAPRPPSPPRACTATRSLGERRRHDAPDRGHEHHPGQPRPSFTLSFANGGTNNEHDVRCKVTVNGTNRP